MSNVSITPSERCAIPLISILIPAFRYSEGIIRILNTLGAFDASDCEVMIYDDSPCNEIEIALTGWRKTTGAKVSYKHNQPAFGAIANWNALLDAARGEYCLLLHHDDFPISEHFVNDIVTALRDHPETDVIILDSILVAPKTGWNRRHVPILIRDFVINHFPQYLYQRNVIGCTGALVVRRSLYPRYDTRLRWLVDVDLYRRLFRASRRVLLCRSIEIGSLLGRPGSITAGLKGSIRKVEREERAYLLSSRSPGSFWLGSSLIHQLLRGIETICWLGMRVLTRTAARLFPCPKSPSEMKRALRGQQYQ